MLPHETTLDLYNIPQMNSDFSHIIYAGTTAAQIASYFTSTIPPTQSLQHTMYQRLNDNTIRVQMSYAVCMNMTFLRYINTSYTTRYVYGVITEVRYINDNCTELVYVVHPFYTYWPDVTLKGAYVDREHSLTDAYGASTTPEGIGVSDRMISGTVVNKSLAPDRFAVIGSRLKCIINETEMDLIPAFEEYGGVRGWLRVLHDCKDDAHDRGIMYDCLHNTAVDNLITIVNYPQVCGDQATRTSDTDLIRQFSTCGTDNVTIDKPSMIGTYTPKNKKVLQSPWTELHVTNYVGDTRTYHFERSMTPTNSINFALKGSFLPKPEVLCYPSSYNGFQYDYDESVSVTDFPSIPYGSDMFKAELVRNKYSMTAGLMSMALNSMAQYAAAGMTGGMSAAATAGDVMGSYSRASGNARTLAGMMDKKALAVGGGIPKSDGIRALTGTYGLQFMVRTVTEEWARVVDDFFSRYGYAVGKYSSSLGCFSASHRPKWHYTQATIDIVGSIPASAKEALKAIFASGVTFWYTSANGVLDYSADNSPI